MTLKMWNISVDNDLYKTWDQVVALRNIFTEFIIRFFLSIAIPNYPFPVNPDDELKIEENFIGPKIGLNHSRRIIVVFSN